MAYAQASDIEDRLGRELDESETRIVETRLEDAEILIRSRIPDLDDQVDSGKIQERAVLLVLAETVLRLIRNIDGYQTETDGNYSYTIDQRVASGRLSILDEEWSLLGLRRGVITIRPVVDIPWCRPEGTNPNEGFGPVHPEHPAVW